MATVRFLTRALEFHGFTEHITSERQPHKPNKRRGGIYIGLVLLDEDESGRVMGAARGGSDNILDKAV